MRLKHSENVVFYEEHQGVYLKNGFWGRTLKNRLSIVRMFCYCNEFCLVDNKKIHTNNQIFKFQHPKLKKKSNYIFLWRIPIAIWQTFLKGLLNLLLKLRRLTLKIAIWSEYRYGLNTGSRWTAVAKNLIFQWAKT